MPGVNELIANDTLAYEPPDSELATDFARLEEARRKDNLQAAIEESNQPGHDDAARFKESQMAGEGLKSIGRNVVVGAYDAIRNAGEFLLDASASIIEGQGQSADAQGGEMPKRDPLPDVDLADVAPEFMAEADALRSRIAARSNEFDVFQQKAIQFTLPFMATMKALPAVSGVAANIGKAAGADAITSTVVWEPHEGRLADLLMDLDSTGRLSNTVIDYMASDPEDTDAEGRFKNVLDGQFAAGVFGAGAFTLKGLVKTGAITLRSAKHGRLRMPEPAIKLDGVADGA